MPAIRVGDIDIEYGVDGQGDETLVLVNGLADTKESWAAQVPAFAQRFRVVSYDNRGVGGTTATPGPYTTAQMAGDLHGLVEALGIGRFHLLGTSMGGMIAQEYAIAHSDRLASVALCNTYAWPGPYCLRMFQLWRELVPYLGVGFTQREILLWAFTPEFVEERPAECAEVEAELAANPQDPAAYLAQLSAIETHDTRDRLSAVTCPVLTLIGERDLIIYPSLSRRMHELLPRSTWVEVPGGHACLWELPDPFNAAVLDFLASVT
jgi:pimeloyl-ACP methyl ester carboxylesterase